MMERRGFLGALGALLVWRKLPKPEALPVSTIQSSALALPPQSFPISLPSQALISGYTITSDGDLETVFMLPPASLHAGDTLTFCYTGQPGPPIEIRMSPTETIYG